MDIDIIEFSEAQYAEMNEAQLMEINAAQLKKNNLDYALEQDMLAEKHRLIENGTFLSGLWEAYCAKRQAKHDRDVEAVRSTLLFYLQYSNRADETAPYEVDYAYPMYERVRIVKSYYETTYTDPEERFYVFKSDRVAMRYLADMYKPLYTYFENDLPTTETE